MTDTTPNVFTDASSTKSTDFAGLNLTVEVNGEMVNLGSIFVTNKGSTKIAKRLYELISSKELDANKPNIRISGVFSSDDTAGSDISADAF